MIKDWLYNALTWGSNSPKFYAVMVAVTSLTALYLYTLGIYWVVSLFGFSNAANWVITGLIMILLLILVKYLEFIQMLKGPNS